MLDSRIRPIIDVPLNIVGRKLAALAIGPNQVTFVGLLFGLFAMYEIAKGDFMTALVFFALNRIADGLDGAVARHTGLTDFGGFLDIVCDFIIYSGVVFSFALYDNSNALAAAFLIFCFVGPITSFLAYAIIAAKKEISTAKRGIKSFYYLGGICEGTETAFILILMCVKPEFFQSLCVIYGILCILTTIGRTYAAYSDFSHNKL